MTERTEQLTDLEKIDRVALAIHRAVFGRKPTEPLRENGGALDPLGATYKSAVAAVRTMQEFS